MFKLTITFPIWTISYGTSGSRDDSFFIDYGPFISEQQARWFWLVMKEKIKRNYDTAIILNEENKEQVYIDRYKPA